MLLRDPCAEDKQGPCNLFTLVSTPNVCQQVCAACCFVSRHSKPTAPVGEVEYRSKSCCPALQVQTLGMNLLMHPCLHIYFELVLNSAPIGHASRFSQSSIAYKGQQEWGRLLHCHSPLCPGAALTLVVPGAPHACDCCHGTPFSPSLHPLSSSPPPMLCFTPLPLPFLPGCPHFFPCC